jgi:hypothetical protein
MLLMCVMLHQLILAQDVMSGVRIGNLEADIIVCNRCVLKMDHNCVENINLINILLKFVVQLTSFKAD